MTYGTPPKELGLVPLVNSEMMFFLYLPIKMPHSEVVRVPDRLRYCDPLLARVLRDAAETLGDAYIDHHVYLTAKTLYVEQGSPGNRPGWHVDGYGSHGDLSYIWHTSNPTEFAVQDFTNIPDDDLQSMVAMTEQVRPECIVTYPNRTLLRLDEKNVHRVNPVVNAGIRTFIKVSVSRHRYNLEGNSHNYLFDYDWVLHNRADLRNVDNKDFVKELV